MRKFRNKVIVNTEVLIENDIQDFLDQKASYQGFKIESITTEKIGDYNGKISKIMVIIVYSFLVEEGN